jgi:DNA-binding transcriptional ArsR family regulator
MVVGMQRKSGLRTALAPVGAVWCGRRGQRRGREREASQGGLIGKCILAYTVSVSDVYKALADPTRRAILDELNERDGQTLFELCTRLAVKHGLGSSRQAISQHLDVLESAGLVRTRRQGRYKFHHLDTTPLETILERWRPTRGRSSR